MNISVPLASLLRRVDAAVLRVLARTPSALSGRQIARLADDSNAAGVRLALLRLAESGLVVVTPRSDAVLYSANREHLLWSLIEEGLAARETFERRLRDVIEALPKPPLSVSLYGSVARGDSTDDSDVDIFIVFEDRTPRDEIDEQVEVVRRQVTAWTGNVAQVFAVTRAELSVMVAANEPLIGSLVSDARAIHGRDIRDLITE